MYKYIFYGFLIGVCIISIFFNNKENEPPRYIGNINIGSTIRKGSFYLYNKHIHHWIIAFIIMIISLQHKKNKMLNIILGISITLLIHGLTYNDCMKF